MAYYINYPKWMTPFVIPGVEFLRWYPLMYIFAFVTGFFLLRYMAKRDQGTLKLNVSIAEDMDMILWTAIFLCIGARLGSCLIYSGSYYYLHPWEIFWPFRNGQFVGLGGMSYHGGVLGAVFGVWFFTKRKKKSFVHGTDTLCCCIPFAYTWGRLGNFFNAELYGRVTTSPFGMLFPEATTEQFRVTNAWVQDIMNKVGIEASGLFVNLPRHPSQLYEAFFEGIVLGCIMWFVVRPRLKKLAPGTATGLYLCLYGFIRFFIEYFREPDKDLGYIIQGGESTTTALFTSILNISMGQILCFIMIVSGVTIILLAKKRAKEKRISG